MDLSKGDLCLQHYHLISLLDAGGVNRKDSIILLNYLLNPYLYKLQFNKIGSWYSSWHDVIRSVPQGSTPGPVLCSIVL